MPRLREPRAAVEIQSLQSGSSGLGDYLGMVEQEGKGLRECYGRKVGGTVLIRFYAPDAAMARSSAQMAMQALEQGVRGIRVEELSLDDTRFDAACDCYIRDMTLRFSAYFYILSEEEDEMFYDFKLEGEIQ